MRYFTRPTQWLRPGHKCEVGKTPGTHRTQSFSHQAAPTLTARAANFFGVNLAVRWLQPCEETKKCAGWSWTVCQGFCYKREMIPMKTWSIHDLSNKSFSTNYATQAAHGHILSGVRTTSEIRSPRRFLGGSGSDPRHRSSVACCRSSAYHGRWSGRQDLNVFFWWSSELDEYLPNPSNMLYLIVHSPFSHCIQAIWSCLFAMAGRGPNHDTAKKQNSSVFKI